MDKFELFAVKHHLDEWPDNINYENLIKGLNDGSLREYCIAYPYNEDEYFLEWERRQHVARSIQDMVNDLRKVFK